MVNEPESGKRCRSRHTSMRAAGRFTNLPSASSGSRARLRAKAVGRHRVRADVVDAVRREDIWDHEAARQYATPGTGMFAPEVLGPTLDRLAGLAGDGRRWSSPSVPAAPPFPSLSGACRSPASSCPVR